MPEAAHYTRRSAAYLHGNPTPTTLPKRKTYRTADRNQLYGRRQDGVYVRYLFLKDDGFSARYLQNNIAWRVLRVIVMILQINKAF
jgi:hypothetical protein